MNLIDEIKQAKVDMEAKMRQMVQDFEDKYHGVVTVDKIELWKHSLSGPFYGKVDVRITCKIQDLT